MKSPSVFISLSLVLLLCSTLVAQTPHHAATTIRGSEYPEKISNNRAWLMELIASTSSPRDSAKVKHHAALHRKGLDEAILAEFRIKFDGCVVKYNRGLSGGKRGTTVADLALHQQFNVNVERLVTETLIKLEASMSKTDWGAVHSHVMASKRHMTFTDDAHSVPAVVTPAVYRPDEAQLIDVQYTTGAFAAAGYTTYSVLDTDGSRWYQTVYLYGASNGPWTCEYNGYDGMWEPPGCPAYHDFYTSNQINGQGYLSAYVGTAWDASTYMNTALEFDMPVGANDGSEWVYSDATVICSVAGYLMSASYDRIWLNMKVGTTYEQWDGTMGVTVGGSPTCNVHHVCSNDPPFIVDLPYVILLQLPPFNNTTCADFTCYGICVRPVFGYPWTCTDDNPRLAACPRLPEGVPNPPQECTPHP